MGSKEFHTLSTCWCVLMQSALAHDDLGRLYLDRDPGPMHEILHHLRAPMPVYYDSTLFEYNGRLCNEAEYFGIVDIVSLCGSLEAQYR